MGKQTIIGIAQMKISRDPDEILVAPNLGSCIGVSAYDPVEKIGGMIHCLLPLSKSDPAKAQENPSTYVDSGVSLLLEKLFLEGAAKETIIISVAGGGNMNDPNNVFEIGKKNYTILKKFLWKNNLLLRGEHIGNSISRTVSLEIGTGLTKVKFQGQTIILG
jgi:chemotaxis protein CheD